MICISCGNKLTEEDLKALTQPERKRLGEIVKGFMAKDRHLSRQRAVEQAYYVVLSESVDGF
jgi:hypothetical protein